MLESSSGIDTLAHHPSTLTREQRVIVYKGKLLCRTPSWHQRQTCTEFTLLSLVACWSFPLCLQKSHMLF